MKKSLSFISILIACSFALCLLNVNIYSQKNTTNPKTVQSSKGSQDQVLANPTITDLNGYNVTDNGTNYVVDGKWQGQGAGCNNSKGNYYGFYAVPTWSGESSQYWTIKGTGFGKLQGKGTVTLSDSKIKIDPIKASDWTDNSIKIFVKSDYTYTSSNSVTLTVKTDLGKTVTKKIQTVGIIKTRGYGQCTWHVANKRLSNNKSIPPTAYTSTTIDFNYIPQAWDGLTYGNKHVGIITSVSAPQKSGTLVTYNITVSEMNSKCDEKVLSWSGQFQIDTKTKQITKSIGSNAGKNYIATGYYR